MITSRFLSDPIIRPIGPAERRARQLPASPRQLWEVMQPLVYQSAVAAARFTAPAGFVTDLGSVPRLPLAFLLTGDVIHAEAVVHDWLFQTHLVATQSIADAVLEEAMIVMEKAAWRRWLILKGVQVGGASSWKSGPSRLRILNHENDLPKIAAGGPAGFQVAGLFDPLPISNAFA